MPEQSSQQPQEATIAQIVEASIDKQESFLKAAICEAYAEFKPESIELDDYSFDEEDAAFYGNFMGNDRNYSFMVGEESVKVSESSEGN